MSHHDERAVVSLGGSLKLVVEWDEEVNYWRQIWHKHELEQGIWVSRDRQRTSVDKLAPDHLENIVQGLVMKAMQRTVRTIKVCVQREHKNLFQTSYETFDPALALDCLNKHPAWKFVVGELIRRQPNPEGDPAIAYSPEAMQAEELLKNLYRVLATDRLIDEEER